MELKRIKGYPPGHDVIACRHEPYEIKGHGPRKIGDQVRIHVWENGRLLPRETVAILLEAEDGTRWLVEVKRELSDIAVRCAESLRRLASK